MIPVVEVTDRLKNIGIGILAGGVVLIDSVSRFWSMAGDLMIVIALVLVTKIPTKKSNG